MGLSSSNQWFIIKIIKHDGHFPFVTGLIDENYKWYFSLNTIFILLDCLKEALTVDLTSVEIDEMQGNFCILLVGKKTVKENYNRNIILDAAC